MQCDNLLLNSTNDAPLGALSTISTSRGNFSRAENHNDATKEGPDDINKLEIGGPPALTRIPTHDALDELAATVANPALRDKHGERVTEGLKEMSRLLVLVSSLGAGFTFTSIVGDVRQPTYIFDISHVSLFLAMSWLLFMLVLAYGALLTMLLIFNDIEVAKMWKKETMWHVGFFFAGALIILTLAGAIAFTGLTVMAYQFWVAIAGFCLAGLVFLGLAGMFFIQLYRELTAKYYK